MRANDVIIALPLVFQRKMLFLDILFLLAFCLVFARADGKDIFDDDGEETETFGDDPVFLDERVDISAETASMEGAPKEEVRRQIVRPPFVRRVTIPISVPGNMNSVFFRTCYCYRRICYG